MHSSRATALKTQLSCRRTRPRFRPLVQNSGAEITATRYDQNNKHDQYATTRHHRSWLDLPLEIPTLLLGELRWLATYVALSRPPSLAQLISVGLPEELRNLIEDGPPEGILSRFNDMFEENERAIHIKAAHSVVQGQSASLADLPDWGST